LVVYNYLLQHIAICQDLKSNNGVLLVRGRIRVEKGIGKKRRMEEKQRQRDCQERSRERVKIVL